MELKLVSTAFANGGVIPSRFTCDGPDISPSLEWIVVGERILTFALVCDDPDAPTEAWVHWVIFNIPGNIRKLAEGIPAQKVLADGSRQGTNDFRKIGYGGPCPPGGMHRYFFRMFALDRVLELAAGANRSQLSDAMKGRVLAQGELMGKYLR